MASSLALDRAEAHLRSNHYSQEARAIADLRAQLADAERERDEWRDSAQVVLDEKAEILTENRLLQMALEQFGGRYDDVRNLLDGAFPLTAAEVKEHKRLKRIEAAAKTLLTNMEDVSDEGPHAEALYEAVFAALAEGDQDAT